MSRITIVHCDFQYPDGTCGYSIPLRLAAERGWYLSDSADYCGLHRPSQGPNGGQKIKIRKIA